MARTERRIMILPDIDNGAADDVIGALVQVVADVEGAERNLPLRMRLDEIPAGVIDYVPIPAFLWMAPDIVREQRLRKIGVIQGFLAREIKDMRPAAYITCLA